MRWTILIPAKALPGAKSRLSGATADPMAHARLVLAIRADTMAAARDAAGVARVVVVTDRPAVVDGDHVFVQSEPGLNAALREGAEHASSQWPYDGVAALVGDLPALRSEELAAALALAAQQARGYVPDAQGTGTTLLTAVAGQALRPAFGAGSAARHAVSAAELTAGTGLRSDVDTAADLRAAVAVGVGPATRAVLAEPTRTPSFTLSRHNPPMSVQRTSGAPRPASGVTATSYGPASTAFSVAQRPLVEPPIDPSDSVPEGDLDEQPDLATDLPADRFSNRELSWLSYNARVLAQAEDPNQALLERLKFLAIFASNLDEFYMVRVAGLKRRADMGLQVTSADGLSPREVLATLAERTRELAKRHARVFRDDVTPLLEAEGIHIRRWEALDEEEKARLADYFRTKVFPVLTPLAVDPGHPFPYISGLSLNLAVLVRDHEGSTQHFARVKVPNNVPRFVVVSQNAVESEFLPLEDLIAAHLSMLFPGMEVVEHHLFRVTRNADFEVEEDRDEDLLQALERELARRRFGPAVRLEVTDDIDDEVLDLLVSEIDVQPEDVQHMPGLIDLSSLWQVYDVDRPALKERPFVPATHPRFAEGETPKSVFATLRDGDVLVHHPYESFATSVQRFIEQAAADPHVLAIKQTLYRTSGDSPIVDALIDAAEAGKQVVALVEIQARFDEQANIKWARALERAGCHVVYGVVGLKTHCKTALVVRQEGGQIKRYAHIGTGNYNPKTARLYEDLGLFTADESICADITDLFNVLTGYSRQTEYRSLLVAPQGIRSGLIERIESEIEHARAGRGGHIQFKTNHLVDEQTIDALYRASRAGVRVQLLVRTFCTIRAGVPGLSENITTRSILGRFLEHSRVYYFGGGGRPEYWIGSADLMHRNLDRRVEVLCEVEDPLAQAHLHECLDMAFAPDTVGWDLHPDDEWIRSDGPNQVDLQEWLMKRLASRGE